MRLAFGVALLCLLPLFWGCSLTSQSTSSSSAKEIEKEVEVALPLGSNRSEIETWLTSRGIEFEYTTLPIGECVGSPHYRFPWEDNYSGAILGNIKHESFLKSREIHLCFILDVNGRLRHQEVNE